MKRRTVGYDFAFAERYARLQLIDWWDQKAVSGSTVLVLGAGAVGNEVAKNLALSGVGRLVIVDFDVVEGSNLTRSVLFRPQDAGRAKAKVAAEAVRRLNPDVEAIPVVGDMEWDLGHGWFVDADAIVGCVDSVHARLAINRICRRIGRPWINTAISATAAEVTLYGAQGPCYECTVDAAALDDARKYSCTGFRLPDVSDKIPTTAVAASLAGAWASQVAVALLHERHERSVPGLKPGQRLLHPLQPLGMFVLNLAESPQCPHHGDPAPVHRVDLNPRTACAEQVLEACGPDMLELHLGFQYIESLVCAGCGHRHRVGKPKPKVDDARRFCSRCGDLSRAPRGMEILRRGEAAARRPLARFGVPSRALLLVTGPERSIWASLES